MLRAMVASVRQYSVVERVDRAKLLHILSGLGAACVAPTLPGPAVAQAICSICFHVCVTSIDHDNEKIREIFMQVDRSGLLRQAIRCATVPPMWDRLVSDRYTPFLDMVYEYCICICKSFQKGKQTGDMLSAVLAGRDGFAGERNPEILCRLTNIAVFCDYANSAVKTDIRGCRKCNKHGPVQLCTGCDTACYCSKECQIADWGQHKFFCSSLSVGALFSLRMERVINGWVKKNYEAFVLPKLRRVMHARNVDRKELVVELDFHGVGTIAPALKTPRPGFKVGMTKNYLEGSRPELPNWFETRLAKDDSLLGLQDRYQRLTDNQVLFFCRTPEPRPAFCRITLLQLNP